MSSLNKRKVSVQTHEGATASQVGAKEQLERAVLSCLLWEDSCYEDGISVAKRIKDLVPKVNADAVAQLATKARTEMKLRHVSLLLVREMARIKAHKHLVSKTLTAVIQRPDELCEFLAFYWKDGRVPLSAQVKKGLAAAFTKFNEYQLAKYNRDTEIKLRDVLFLSHAKPLNDAQAQLWKRLINNELQTPDTWEVALSAGGDKKETWERLLSENKLGALALLRNLRNIQEAGVNSSQIESALLNMRTERVLPFRFIAAAKYAPQLEPAIESAMLKCINGMEKLPGRTCLLIDVSGSMEWKLSDKSDMTRLEAASALGILLREICDKVNVYTFSDSLVPIPARHGFALRDAIKTSQPNSGTQLGRALQLINNISFHEPYDRLIVVTDEQSQDSVAAFNPLTKSYIINVAPYKNGVGYGQYTHINGFSENVIKFIQSLEA